MPARYVDRWRNENPERYQEQLQRAKDRRARLALKRAAYRERYGERDRAKKREDRAEKRAYITNYRAERGCKLCSEREPCALDLHHIDPAEKEFAPSQACKTTWKRLLSELSKCVVLCANCHRKVHAGVLEL